MEVPSYEGSGATDLEGALPILARNTEVKALLVEVFGESDAELATEMMSRGVLSGDLGSSIHDFFLDEIVNEAVEVWRGTILDPEAADDDYSAWPVTVQEYRGVFYVGAVEYDDVGYFHTKDAAIEYVIGNWDNVEPDPSV